MSKKTLSELRIDAEEAKKELNTAILNDSFSGMQTAKDRLDKAVKEYNSEAIIADFITLRSKAEPMKEAIEQLNIATITVKPNKNKETDIVTYSIEPSVKQIDLVAFDEFCRREKIEISCDKMWHHMVDRLCLAVTYRIIKSLGGETKKLEETYYISDIARKIDMGGTPLSNNQLLKQIQSVVDAIIYEECNGKNQYRVTSHDVVYINETMSKRGSSGKVVTPRPTTMHMLVMDVLHRIITNSDYKVEYQTKKQAKEETESSIIKSK